MVTMADLVSSTSRVAADGEGIGIDELRLAGRNHAMPLEALRYDLTPAGLHYLLIHYDIPDVEPAGYRLGVDGHVERTLELNLDDVRSRPQVTLPVTFECAGNGRARLLPRPVSQPWLDEAVGTAEWTGTPLAPLLREAGVRAGAREVVFTGHDHGIEFGSEQDYARALPLAEALADDVLLAHSMNGQPLPPQHGAPLRLVVPGWYGMTQVKWLRRISVLDHVFPGFHNASAYRFKQSAEDVGEPVTRIAPRALMVPPGFPDFMTRTRVVDLGVHVLAGRAWSGWAPVERVQVSTDDGATWSDAVLDEPLGRWAWRGWRWRWAPERPGQYVLRVRADDGAGNAQPLQHSWNRQGMSNTSAQRVEVVVREPAADDPAPW
jgi:sulfane dehydrogenase subunit SoxC